MEGKNLFNDLEILNEYLHQQTLQRVKERGVGYVAAYQEIMRESPALRKCREGLCLKRVSSPSESKHNGTPQRHLVETEQEINGLVLAATEKNPRMERALARRLVADEHPGLFRTYEQLMSYLHG